MIETFTALAEPSRLRIVELLLDGPKAVNDIVAALDISQPQASKHLGVLKRARLVDVEPRAQQRLYGLRPERFRDMNEWLDRHRALWDERMGQLDELVAEMAGPKSKPKPKKEARNARRRKK